MTDADWTYGTKATEPYELVDARCTCGWISKATTAEHANELAAAHRRRWAEIEARGEVMQREHYTTVAPIELHGDRLVAEPITPPARKRRRSRRLELAHRIMLFASRIVTTFIDRRAEVRVIICTVEVQP